MPAFLTDLPLPYVLGAVGLLLWMLGALLRRHRDDPPTRWLLPPSADPTARYTGLTERERRVVRLMETEKRR